MSILFFLGVHIGQGTYDMIEHSVIGPLLDSLSLCWLVSDSEVIIKKAKE